MEPFLASVMIAATPFLFAAMGELVAERSGVLNLGVEGMMLMGAVCAFAAAFATGSTALGLLAGAAAGLSLALVFCVIALGLMANQAATGLALTIFGVGASAFIGQGFVGQPLTPPPALAIPVLSDLGMAGRILFAQDALVYLGVAMAGAVWWFLARSRAGLILRAVGDSHDAAHALGHPVIRVRWLATLFGGAMAGLGGAYLSLAYTPMWGENMTAGRGWIALALVVFATWRPERVIVGAYLFAAVTQLQFYGQGWGLGLPPQALAALPYLATVAALVLISRDPALAKANAPACIGRAFRPAR
jgi:simple sugar transport system permease protein